MHLLSIILQWLSGAFLGFVGLVLMGDFTAWWRQNKESRPDVAGCLMLLLYLAALAAIRWLH